MTIRVTTGNQLDVVYDYIDDKQTLLGLQQANTDVLIPLPDPEGLLQTLEMVMRQIAEEQSQ